MDNATNENETHVRIIMKGIRNRSTRNLNSRAPP